jgi:hypothetical protein
MFTEEEKLTKYRAGLYKMPVPPVCTILWIEENWIEYIDREGVWL